MKTDTAFTQKGKRIGAAGGFFNQLMSHNCSVPVVGEGATELLYSDRHAYEVLEVNEAKKTAVLQRYAPTPLFKGMTDSQAYEYKEFEGEPFTVHYKWGSWKTKSRSIVFVSEAVKQYGIGRKLHDAYKNAGGIYVGAFASTIIPGLTKEVTKWNARNFIFGVKDEYYDFSF